MLIESSEIKLDMIPVIRNVQINYLQTDNLCNIKFEYVDPNENWVPVNLLITSIGKPQFSSNLHCTMIVLGTDLLTKKRVQVVADINLLKMQATSIRVKYGDKSFSQIINNTNDITQLLQAITK